MASCNSCGREIGWTEMRGQGMCPQCHKAKLRAERTGETLEQPAPVDDPAIHAVLLTTETHPDLPIRDRLEIVTAECAFGMNMFKDLFAGVRDVFGGRSEAVQRTMRETRRTVLFELKREAHSVGANAVVGVDLDYTELSAFGNMVLMVASGTAVVLEASSSAG